MSGQKAKYSLRVDIFRFTEETDCYGKIASAAIRLDEMTQRDLFG
jgi:hypothetical protein